MWVIIKNYVELEFIIYLKELYIAKYVFFNNDNTKK